MPIYRDAKNLLEVRAQSIGEWCNLTEFRRLLSSEPGYVYELLKFGAPFYINPSPRKHIHRYEKLVDLDVNSFSEDLPVTWVPWNSIRLIQANVYIEGIKNYSDNLQTGKLLIPPTCYRSGQYNVVVDGTHRTFSLYVNRAVSNLNSDFEGLFVLASDQQVLHDSLYSLNQLELV